MKSPHHVGFILILMSILLLSACSPTSTTPLPEGSSPQAQPSLPPKTLSAAAIESARSALAQQLGVEATQLEIFSAESRQFSDNCLGLPQAGESCSPTVVSGYQGIILGEGVQYEFRVSEDGKLHRFLPGAARSAQQVLAAQLGLPPTEIRILRFEAVDWSNACLGVETPGLMCAEVITPGFRILLEAEGKRYEMHTDRSGSDVRLLLAPALEGAHWLLKWQGGEGELCQMVYLGEDVLSYGTCEQPLTSLPLVGRQRRQEMQMFLQKYAPFEAQTAIGRIVFQGKGAISATASEQRMMAEWARQLWMEHDPQAKLPSPVVIAFHREGGLAAVCDDVLIYRSGLAEVSSCRAGQQIGVQTRYLTATQLQEVYRWLDTYLPFESNEVAANPPQDLKWHLVFNGEGQQEAPSSERQKIADLAQEVGDQARQVQDPAALEAVKGALVAYLEALKQGDYQTVVSLYGGSYDVLADMNPDVSPADRIALWTRACEQNGFVCNLTVKNWVQIAQLSDDEFRLSVELQNADGSLFELGPCCGEEMEAFPPLTQFEFVVKRVGEAYLVQRLPVFVP